MSASAGAHRRILAVAAVIAAPAALAGGAVAATSLVASGGTIKSCVARSNGAVRIIPPAATCRGKRERTLRWNQRGPRGLDGPPGATGAQGTPGDRGAPGAPGAPAASLLTGRLSGLNEVAPDDDADRFGAPSGLTADGGGSDPNVTTLSPATATVAQGLSAHFNGGVGDGTIKVTLWVDDGPTALTCTITSASPDATCSDNEHSVDVPPSTPVSIEANESTIGKSTVISSGSVLFGWRSTTP